MLADGSFKGGHCEYDLVAEGAVTADQAVAYAEKNNPTIPVAFGAARDAFYMDHPELFYADVHKVGLGVAADNGTYKVFAGTGRADNFYSDYTVSSASEAETAVAEFEKKADEVVKLAGSGTVVEKITNVNDYFVKNVKYDYGAKAGAVMNGYVHNAYGALVQGKAMCDGYATAFKVIMDRLDIPCVLIAGNACQPQDAATAKDVETGFEPHMWNAVKVDGLWYAVDPTWNATCGSGTRYLLVGDEMLSRTHYPNGEISSSGFKLLYPAVRPTAYGVDVDENGFEFKDSGKVGNVELGYVSTSVGGETVHGLQLGVSYDGKNAKQLSAEGKELAYRYYINGEPTMWFHYMTVLTMTEQIDTLVADKYSMLLVGTDAEKVQYAIVASDVKPTEFGAYPENINGSIIAESAAYHNEAYNSQKNVPRAPYVKRYTPNFNGYISNFEPTEIMLEYSENLVPADGSAMTDDYQIQIALTGNTHDDLSKNMKVENVKYDSATKQLKFTFTPSRQYRHNNERYSFIPVNLVGETSGRVPEAGGSFYYKMKQIVCPKVFNDGRLYMKVFGEPKFVGAEDMSLTDFKDKDGAPIVGDQRSQLMLVVNSPSKAETADMESTLLEDKNIGVEKDDVLASSTYEIDLMLCGVVRKVPDGSYMQVGFGFPDGYGPEDAGVTFTVYHYTRDAQGKIKSVEEVPCVITDVGIIATVKRFSPFMIAAVKSDAKSTHNVYTSVVGEGGKLDRTKIESVAEGDSISYTVTPESGYKVDRVLLNGTEVKGKVAAEGGKLEFTYAELNGKGGNVVEVSFVADRVAKFYSENNYTAVQPRVVVTQSDMIEAVGVENAVNPGIDTPEKSNTVLIVCVVLAVVIVAAGAAVAIVFILRNKKKDGGDGNNGGGTAVKTRAETTDRVKDTATAEKKVKSEAAATKTEHAAAPTQRANTSAQRTTTPTQRANTTAQRTTTPTQRTNTSAQRSTRPSDKKDKK